MADPLGRSAGVHTAGDAHVCGSRTAHRHPGAQTHRGHTAQPGSRAAGVLHQRRLRAGPVGQHGAGHRVQPPAGVLRDRPLPARVPRFRNDADSAGDQYARARRIDYRDRSRQRRGTQAPGGGLMGHELLAIVAIARKDIGVWARQPTAVAATVLPAVVLIGVLYIGAAAVGHNPVALVVDDSGPHAQQLVQILADSDAFVVTRATQDEASTALADLQVAAVITIPADFDSAFDAHRPDPVDIRINNLNLDFTNDLRRSLPAAIAEFYAQEPDSPIGVSVAETDLRVQDIGLVQFDMVPDLV